MLARAAHAIPSGPKAPTQRQRLSGRPPRSGGMRAGGTGRTTWAHDILAASGLTDASIHWGEEPLP